MFFSRKTSKKVKINHFIAKGFVMYEIFYKQNNKNEKQNKRFLEDDLKKMESEFKMNIQNWNKQIGIIEKLLKFRCKNFAIIVFGLVKYAKI